MEKMLVNLKEKNRLSRRTKTLLEENYISEGPEAANHRIKEAFDCELSRSGLTCKEIIRIRSLVTELNPKLGYALSINAPHTHWSKGDIIVEQFDSDKSGYLIGPSDVLPNPIEGPLVPISFVFTREGPKAYEWSDKSTSLIDSNNIDDLWKGIRTLNDKIVSDFEYNTPIPIGLSLNHQFQDVWEKSNVGTTERPDPENPEYALITRNSDDDDLSEEQDAIQVGWSAAPLENFSDDELEALRKLEIKLETLSPEEEEDFLEALEDHLSELVG
jgi:hypothetical protein